MSARLCIADRLGAALQRRHASSPLSLPRRAAVIESGKLVKNGDDVRALWSALSQFLTSAFLAWETVATKSLMAPTITGATVLALAAYLSTAELPWLPVTATPRTPERGEGWAPMGSRASGQGQQVAKESGDK